MTLLLRQWTRYWLLLKISFSIKPYLVTSNGELLIVEKNCKKRLPLKLCSFEKQVIFHEFDFETSFLEFEVSISSI